MELNKHGVGLSLGIFMALVHLAWTVVVLVGGGQWVLDMIFKAHYLNNPFVISGFSILRLVGLLVLTFVAGYVFGWVFAWVWNKYRK